MLEKEPIKDKQKVKSRANTLAHLTAGIALIPALAVSACGEINEPQSAHNQEAPTSTQSMDLNQLLEDYLKAVVEPDPLSQGELMLEFPVSTSSGQKTLGECVGDTGFTQDFESPSEAEDKLILTVNLKTGENLAWNFEKQKGVWELSQVPNCP